ncbi:FAD-binding protein [Colwellia psychrerythraea]|uniref:4-cresol dehydrogenase (Hydroxylating) n=1 Tax=Colwellia psychrerythraea TaxID=28229 RepID=A0A099KL60_COLPS|nr:FAD-binding protein [Colwellia psychrerythraea]KGJ91146.1 4-cresol dehydrogenase (hydroxylating) [Colwellia psychrerythraea]
MSPQLASLIENVLTTDSSLSFEPQLLARSMLGTEGLECFSTKQRQLMAVITITQANEIKALIDLANQCATDETLAFSLYPVSTGQNWGYGTSQPTGLSKNIILLDLGQLTQISHFDNELGLVTIEPGVTQQQLSIFLQQHNYDYMVPVTGAGPECSILANALERGYGITPYTDHFSAVTSIQGYWGNGTPYQSAISELDSSEGKFVDKTFKWGLGPYLEGLFTQSNFGIVSQMTIRLAKIKPGFTSFFIQMQDDDLLERAIPLIRKVLQDYEGIVGSINLMDQRRLLSMFAKNPNGNDSHQVMANKDINKLAKELRTPSWTIVGSIYGSIGVVKAVKKEINQIFKQLPCKRIYSNSSTIIIANKVINSLPTWFISKTPILSKVSEQLDSFNKGKEIMLGKPNKVALKLAYWRHKGSDNFDKNDLSPGQDGCGLLWYAPLITMKAGKVREFVEFIRNTCPKFNIEPFITFTNLKHDCIDSTIPIVFDLSNPRAVEDAHNCLKSLVEEGLKKGFVPYRLNIDQQQYLLNKDSHFWQTVNKIKSSLDPHNILSQARYNPR